jgi:predicted ATP-grasp superfamily ATP-dependent carboligase
VILGITEQLIGLHEFGSRGFRYCGNILPLPELLDSRVSSNVLDQLNSLAAFLTKEYRLTGVNGVDFILKGDRVCLTEINPRYSASMELIERAYDIPIFHLHTQAVLDGTLPEFNLSELLNHRKFFGKVILFAEREAIMPDTQSWAAKGICDIPESDEKIPAGGPICTLLSGRPTYNKTLADLTDRAKELKEEIYGKTDSDLDNRTFDQAGYRNIDWKGTDRLSGSH